MKYLSKFAFIFVVHQVFWKLWIFFLEHNFNCGGHSGASMVVRLQNVLASWNDSVGQERIKASMIVMGEKS